MALLPCQSDMLSTLRVFEKGKGYHCPRRRVAAYTPSSECIEVIIDLICGECTEPHKLGSCLSPPTVL